MGRGGSVRKDQFPLKKNPRKKSEGETRLGQGPKSPHGGPCTRLGFYTLTPHHRRARGCGAGIWVGVFGGTFFL
jgi:hypothetical protein